jgi:hypothetical protein
MKKQLLMVLAISASLSTFAQNRPVKARVHIPTNAKPVAVTKPQGGINDAPLNTNTSASSLSSSTAARAFSSVTETKIGETVYDLQTNSAIMNRFIKHSDGSMSASWTFAPIGSATGFPLRGTGYNYFDGTNWGAIPSARIEPTTRTGFVNIIVPASGREMSIGHSGTGMLLTGRGTKGAGAWAENTTVLGGVASDTWSKAKAGGANGESVHALWNANSAGANGQESSLYYSRSLDGGITWPILRTLLSDLDSSKYTGFGGDAYSIDTHGDTVCFVVGDFDTDLVLMRSNDNGITWTSTVIQPFFQPLYDDLVDSFPDLNGDGTSDRMEGPSGDAHVMIDNLGKVHVWWSNVIMQDTSASDEIGYFPNGLDGLLYWNDGFLPGQAPDTIAFAQDGLNANGTLDIPSTGLGGANGMGGYRGSITQMPTAGVDANNNIYLAYQSYCEDCDTTAFNTGHKHIYMIATTNQGATWSNPTDIDQSADLLNQEDVFACVAKTVDANCIHVIYQRDGAPGHALSANTVEAGWNSVSDIIYACVTPSDILGVKAVKANATSGLSQNNPNPSDGITNISYKVTANQSKVTFDVTDLLGNVVYTEDKGTLNAGSYNLVLNTENLSAGVYFYTLTVNNKKETRKMMVN